MHSLLSKRRMLPTVSCETHDDVNSLPRYRGWRIPSPCLRPHSSGAVRMGMSGACPTEQHNLAIKTRHARNSTYATLFWMTWSLRIDGDVLFKRHRFWNVKSQWLCPFFTTWTYEDSGQNDDQMTGSFLVYFWGCGMILVIGNQMVHQKYVETLA